MENGEIVYKGNRNMKRGEIVEVGRRWGSLNEERVKADGAGRKGSMGDVECWMSDVVQGSKFNVQGGE